MPVANRSTGVAAESSVGFDAKFWSADSLRRFRIHNKLLSRSLRIQSRGKVAVLKVFIQVERSSFRVEFAPLWSSAPHGALQLPGGR